MTILLAGIAQIACEPGDVAANHVTHLGRIAEAHEAGCRLLLFPELSLTDYLAEPDREALPMAADDPRIASLAAAAGAMAVSFGFIERGDDGRLFNAQAFVRDGRLVAVHRKLNLPGYGRLHEDDVYAAGDRLDPVELSGTRTATLICADAWNPALPWLAAIGGAELLLVPAASARGAVDGFDNPRGWRLVLEQAAMVYGLPILFANHCGRRGELDFWGGSRILDAEGREIARADDRPGLVLADIDLAAARVARYRLPTARDADPTLVARLLDGLVRSGRGRHRPGS